MHPDYTKADNWSGKVIGTAIEVHKDKGPGLIESIYEKCLMWELELQRIPAGRQIVVPVEYKGYVLEEPLKLDLWVDQCLLPELKAVEKVLSVHKAQLMSYMKLLNAPLSLVINFNELTLAKGVARRILPGANNT